MKALAPSASLWMPLAKAGLGIAIAMSMAHVQAATDAPAPTGVASQGDAAKPPAARPHRHRKEVTLAPVRPESYPSNPLPPVPQKR
jgi:hypothetical protein